MPELPEVETVRLQLENQILGSAIESVKTSRLSLRKPLLASTRTLKNKEISKLSRWGKRLFIHIGDEAYLDVSLGMTGKFRVESDNYKRQKHDHITLVLENKNKLVYNDARRFGWVHYNIGEPFLSGWDPILSPKRDFKEVIKAALRTEVDAYTFLMNQKYIVGLGNIYVQEILFKAGISPFRKIKSLNSDDMERIRLATKAILKRSLKLGGSTILNYQSLNGSSGAFQTKLNVYGKKSGENCGVCNKPIKYVQNSRSVCYCSTCQS